METWRRLLKLRSGLTLARMYFRVNIASVMEYRASFISSAAGMFFSNATFIFFWRVLFYRAGGGIGGYDFRDVMFIWAAASASYGIVNALLGNISHINEIVVSGALDAYLLQPRNVLFSLLASRTEFSAWGDMLYGLLLLLFTNPGLGAFSGFLLAVFSGGIVLASVMVVLQSTVFFLGDSSFLSSMSITLTVNFNTYPEGIFPRLVRILLYLVIPSQFMVHVPLRIARGEGVIFYLPLQLVATVAFAAFAMWFFRAGLRRYESGNLIATRT